MKTHEIKYTTDGRKVVMVGVLNQSEKIVQEIFVAEDGTEMPSGERFVVKTLLDTPAKTWRQKELEQLEQIYESERKEWETKINNLRKEKSLAYAALAARVKWLRNVAKEPHQQELKDAISRIADILANENKYVVVRDYCRYTMAPFNDEGINILDRIDRDFGRTRYDSMRLLSLYGDCSGNLEFRINTYSDGSGNDQLVMFFRDEKQATEYIQAKINAVTEYTRGTIETAEAYGLRLDSNKLKAYQAKQREYIEKEIAALDQRIEGYKRSLNDIASFDSILLNAQAGN